MRHARQVQATVAPVRSGWQSRAFRQSVCARVQCCRRTVRALSTATRGNLSMASARHNPFPQRTVFPPAERKRWSHGMQTCKWLSDSLIALAVGSALAPLTAVAQKSTDELPAYRDLDSISAEELASRLRTIDHLFINWLPAIRQGRMTLKIRDGSRAAEVTAQNASRWERDFMERRYALYQAARTRGYRDISGSYLLRMNPPSCILESPPTRVVIGQVGLNFEAYFSTKFKLSGVVVEDQVDLPLYGGPQPKPFFKGIATDQVIRLTNGDSCEVELVKN